MEKLKPEVITFKAEPSLIEAISHIKNRSEFIRHAILAALENTCPVCLGSGILTPDGKKHWDNFMQNHLLKECQECNERYIICASNQGAK
jgi:hypothetical protein